MIQKMEILQSINQGSWRAYMNIQIEQDISTIPKILTLILDCSINGITLSDPNKEDNPLIYANNNFKI